MAGADTFDWEALARMETHKIRSAIIEANTHTSRAGSPIELSKV